MSQAGSAYGGTVRRSARFSQPAASIVSQAVAESSPAPARRRGPLPKIKARKSTAYGSIGRIGDAEELAVSATGFTQAFQTQRVAAVAREYEPMMSGALPVPSGALNGNSARATPIPDGSEIDFTPPTEGEPSGADTSKSFGPVHEGGMLNRSQLDQSIDNLISEVRQDVERRNREPAAAEEVLQEPVDVPESEHAWRWHRYLLGLLVALGLVAFMMLGSFAFTNSSNTPIGRIPGLLHAMNHRAISKMDDWTDWIMPDMTHRVKLGHSTREKPPGGLQAGLKLSNNTLWVRMHQIHQYWDQRLSNVHDELDGVKLSIQELGDSLPHMMVVTRRADGSIKIPDEFWRALLSKLQSGSDDPAWTDFLEATEAKVREISGFDLKAGTTENGPDLLHTQAFQAAMEIQYDKLSKQVNAKISQALSSNLKKTPIDELRLESLALTNLLANIQLSLKKVNYFSTGLGAKIDSGMTSATSVDNPAILARILRRLFLVPKRNPPKSALEDWKEPGDCWCSAPDEANSAESKGKAQLVVNLPKKMRPTQITLEHPPKDMFPNKNVSTAPRDVELWVQSDVPASFDFKHLEDQCDDGPAGWICLGRVQYDINGLNHIQTFDLDGHVSRPINKAMVRILRSHGADSSCVYRVRLHGRDPEDEPDFAFSG